MRWILACLLLTGCASTANVPAAVSVTPTVTTLCLPLKTYTAAQEKAQSAALVALADNNPLVGMIADYGAMRAADRACLAAH